LPNLNEIQLKGIPSSPGIALGRAKVIKPEQLYISNDKIPQNQIIVEIKRLNSAIDKVVEEFNTVIEKVRKESDSVVSVLETNLVILGDNMLFEAVKTRISDGLTAESALVQEVDHLKQYIRKTKDSILFERTVELDHIRDRLLATLRDNNVFQKIEPGTIIIAQSVSPSEMVNFQESAVAAVVTEVGGITSHSSILARSFEIPQVIGVKDAASIIWQNAQLVIDGFNGLIFINPNEETWENYLLKKNRIDDHKKQLGTLIKLPAETTDGKSIKLLANIDFPQDVESAIVVGAEGIGLVRTEHIFIAHNNLPDEDEQFKAYKDIADKAYPHEVTLRVFDLGGDKYTEGMHRHENNPALGFRGIRLLLQRPDIFEPQLRAILKASKNKNIRLMLPMISSFKELVSSIEKIEECKRQLDDENIPFDREIPIGIMIETPAAAILAELFAENVKFFSIGTNDLTQYTLAADRTNELMSDFFDSFHPSVLKLIKITVDAAKIHGIPVGICGELASHAAATSLLIGLGIEEFSVAPSVLLALKSRVRETNYEESIKLADYSISGTGINTLEI
jgi:phosphoenolpyruvate-protein phosphotransferase (PTS system enzyme I)